MPRGSKSSKPKNNTLITSFYSKGAHNPKFATKTPVQKIKNHIDQFYDLQLDACRNKDCANNISELREQLIAIKAKHAQIEKAQAVAREICDDKDKEIANLQRKVDAMSAVAKPNSTEMSSESVSNALIGNSSPNDLPFIQFANNFKESHLKTIRSIGESISEDSTFILQILRGLYADNLEQVKHISVTGRSGNNTKEKIAPEKMSILSSMFAERLSGLPQSKNRNGNLNQLTARALVNITNAMRSQNNNKETISKINEQFKDGDK